MKTLGIMVFLGSLELSKAAATLQCDVPGMCQGFNLDVDIIDTPKECLVNCQANPECQWITYDAESGFCIGFANCTEVDVSCTSCISAERACTFYSCFIQGECHGNAISFGQADSQEKCLVQCQALSECNWFSYSAEDQICVLLQDCQLDEDSDAYVSGERGCDSGRPDYSKVFLQHYFDTTYIDMPNTPDENSTCLMPAPYPFNVEGSIGAVVDGQITVCGGYVPDSAYHVRYCFLLSREFNLWSEFAEMAEPRTWASSVITPRGWWITGGHYGDTYLSSSIIYISRLSDWLSGPELPMGRDTHCIAQIDSERAFLAGGGHSTSILADAYIYSWADEMWTQVADMPTARYGVGCGVYTDSQGEQHVIVAGSVPTDASLVVESFSLATMNWTKLAELPSPSRSAAIVQDGPELFLFNPAYDNVMQFDEESGSFSIVEGVSTVVSGGPATVIPVEVPPGC